MERSGSSAANVDVYRNGARITTTANDGAYADSYKVCNAGTTTCSNDSSVTF